MISTSRKRKLEITNELDVLKKREKLAKAKIATLLEQTDTIQKTRLELEQEIDNLQRLEKQPVKNHLVLNSLEDYLIMPIILICQSFNTSDVCKFCALYHLIGFCRCTYI